MARDELAEAERRVKSSAPAILLAFVPLAPARLDLDRLERNFEPPVRSAKRNLAAPPAMGDLAMGASAVSKVAVVLTLRIREAIMRHVEKPDRLWSR